MMKKRIIIVDAIRGFALLGIILIHSIEQFDLGNYPESSGFFAVLNTKIKELIFFLFSGKAYSIFSIMFGFSFFIQLNNSEQRGVDFRMRFLWRLVLLFIIGYIFSLFYIGEVLTVFAILGLVLIPLYKCNIKVLLFLAFLCIVQIPILYKLLLSIADTNYQDNSSWHHWHHVSSTYMNGSFFEVIQFNSIEGHLAKWQFLLNTGRHVQMIGLFIIGLILGKLKYFKNINQHKKHTLNAMFLSGFVALLLYYAPVFIEKTSLIKVQQDLLKQLAESYFNFAFTLFLITLFITTYTAIQHKIKNLVLSYYGKMSLTNYVIQSLMGTLFFYGYGLAMYQYFGVTLCFIYGIVFFILQGFICKIWLKYFYYGPLEWLWRALTFKNFKLKFRIKKELF